MLLDVAGRNGIRPHDHLSRCRQYRIVCIAMHVGICIACLLPILINLMHSFLQTLTYTYIA